MLLHGSIRVAQNGEGRVGRIESGGPERGLAEGRALLLDGDGEGLRDRLADDPSLVDARWPGAGPPYDGYFHGATLLHHVAGNPLIRPLPSSVVEGARVLLDAGAEVDVATLAGPSQPDDVGWTTLGLVATSAEARRSGVQGALLELLLERGADVDTRNGGSLMGALYYGETEAAERLAAAGARLDLAAAAGVGNRDRLEATLAGGAAEIAGRPRLVHYSRVPWPGGEDRETETAHLLGMGLIYAALHGRTDALALLLEAGADPAHRPPFDHRATPLHWAVMGDRPESVRVLLEAGADPEARDGEFDATPRGWARHLGRPRAEAALP